MAARCKTLAEARVVGVQNYVSQTAVTTAQRRILEEWPQESIVDLNLLTLVIDLRVASVYDRTHTWHHRIGPRRWLNAAGRRVLALV